MAQKVNDCIWIKTLCPLYKQNNMALIVAGFFLRWVIYHASTVFGFENLQQLILKSLPRDYEYKVFIHRCYESSEANVGR